MDNNDKVEYWLDLADYDLDSSRVMFNGGKYLYVGFMCHQVAEKAIKAFIAKHSAEDEIPPKSHNLVRLSDIAGITEKMTPEQSRLIEVLNPLNIEARYPEYKNRLIASLTNDYCKRLIKETEDLLCWIKQQL